MLTSSSIRPSALKPTKPNHLEIARKQQGCRQFGKPNRATPNKKQLGTILGSLFRPQDSTGRSSAAIACLGQPVGHLKPQFFCGGLLDNINGSFAGCLNYRKNIICVIFTHTHLYIYIWLSLNSSLWKKSLCWQAGQSLWISSTIAKQVADARTSQFWDWTWGMIESQKFESSLELH